MDGVVIDYSSETSPYLQGPFAPVDGEDSRELEVVAGELPRDLNGGLFRNGPNPRFAPKGRYHWFDGDGMIHAVRFDNGRAVYQRRWVLTAGLQREIESQEALWSGVMESVRNNPKDAPYKNVANTDLVGFRDELLALWYLSGTAYRVRPADLETLGPANFGSERELTMSAHAKVDPKTGDLHFFDYGFRPPFMHYGVVKANGELAFKTPVPLPGPRLPHDTAITENHAILMDLPIVYDLEALARGRWVTRFDREQPARFAIVPKGRPGEARWFEASPCYIYHSVNAWEEDGRVVMVGCRVDDPLPAPKAEHGSWARMMANLRVTASLHRWVFDLESGQTEETRLDDLNTEFPTIDARSTGRKTRFSTHMRLAPSDTLLFDGLVRYDTDSGAHTRYECAAGEFLSETPFAPRDGSVAEDDGYLVSLAQNERAGRSECLVFDAKAVDRGPVCRLAIPGRVPLGFHACWIESKGA